VCYTHNSNIMKSVSHNGITRRPFIIPGGSVPWMYTL
jgi:hypothetical protein